jgi:serine phosphatase RsbU (regulator of sigma subunit)
MIRSLDIGDPSQQFAEFKQVHSLNRHLVQTNALLQQSLTESRRKEAALQWAERELARATAEFQVARTIQQKLYPTSKWEEVSLEVGEARLQCDIGGASYPAGPIGGDYYDFLSFSDGSLGIAIGDVSGHGIGPALLMSEARALVRAFARTQTDVSTILEEVNRLLVPDIAGDYFITLLLAKLDLRGRCLVYASAGHQTSFLLDANGTVKQALPSTSIPLGFRLQVDFPTSALIPLQSGDLVLLVTDGIEEARSPEGIDFGQEQLLDVVRTSCQATAQQIVTKLYQAVCAFSQGRTQRDDITATVIKITEERSTSGPSPALS